MKQIIALILLLAMTVSLFSACGSDNSTPTQPTQNSKPTSPTQPTQEATQATTDSDGAQDSTYTVTPISEILALPLKDGESTEDRYYIEATVDKVSNASYGEMTVSDATGSIYVYGSYSADGSVGYANMEDKPYSGDKVVLSCTIQNYKGTIEVKNAWIYSFTHVEPDISDEDYLNLSIQDARSAKTGEKVKVSGVVAKITYAYGMVPSGFILMDGTDSIYIYDRDAAGRVKEGNTVTVACTKDYWILEDEQSAAQKFGYLGCNQLTSATIVEIDQSITPIPTEDITETTVKSLLDTPVSQDISSQVYKVTALIKKVVGTGFTNYYINDLDGITGSYVYTQCSGSDFEWLDEFDGKICTVYLTALNAKSTASGCFWRLLPVAVCDENFDVTTVDVSQHVVDYYGIPQFLSEYSGDPALELITTVDSQLLNFTGASLSYASSDISILHFENNVMHCTGTGTATVTVTGNYNGTTHSKEITITVTANESVDSITVSDAISTASGETVTVHGIVGPSLVNQNGFYLIDETGIIAVLMDSAEMETISIGNEVVLTGLRYTKREESNYYGQTLIKDTTVVANYYGNHDYCDDTFVHGTTLSDFYALNVMTDYSTTVFVVNAIVEFKETNYYTSIQLSDGKGTTVSLYCSGAGQYSWLKEFSGQEVTLELAACNWNGKNYWRGCVLSVILEDGSKVVNSLNFQ